MSDPYKAISYLLDKIESELRYLNLWQFEMLPDSALESTQPFAVDKLAFPQWLQFIFLPRMCELIEQENVLPASCSIAPMAEHYFASLNLRAAPTALIEQLQKVDLLLSPRA